MTSYAFLTPICEGRANETNELCTSCQNVVLIEHVDPVIGINAGNSDVITLAVPLHKSHGCGCRVGICLWYLAPIRSKVQEYLLSKYRE